MQIIYAFGNEIYSIFMHIANLMIDFFADYVIKSLVKPTPRINGYRNYLRK